MAVLFSEIITVYCGIQYDTKGYMVFGATATEWAMASSFKSFLDHIQ